MEYLRTHRKKVLTALAVLLVFIGLAFIASYFLESKGDINEFEITNLSSNSFTLSWSSEKAYIASVQYSDSDNWPVFLDKLLPKSLAFDDRDVLLDSNNIPEYSSVKAFPRNFHHVTIRNLEAGKQYYFRINGNLRTFVPGNNTATTLEQSDKVAEPDPAYGKVINYAADGDNPQDGIVYYNLINKNDENDVSAKYSSTIGSDSGWSGDLSNIFKTNGSLYKWDKENFKLQLEIKTDEGYGWSKLSLSQYKPLEDAIVNIRYLSSEVVLGASTEADVLGINTVQKVSAGSAIENGKPVCKSPYSESCGDNCSRDITCQGDAFRAGECKCAAPSQPTCPVATIWNGSTCASTAVGTKDETKSVPPSEGGGDKVADKPQKPNDPKTRDEANKQVPAGAGSSKGTGGSTKVTPAACKEDPKGTKSMSNGNQLVGGLYCNACVQTTDGRKTTSGGQTYVCKDPSKGWELEDSTKTCPATVTCPNISCVAPGEPILHKGELVSTTSGNVLCKYSGTNTFSVGTCSGGKANLSVSEKDKNAICGDPDASALTLQCINKLNDIHCPSAPSKCGNTSVSINKIGEGHSASDVTCSYQMGSVSKAITMATCNKGIASQTGGMDSQICSSFANEIKKTEVGLIPVITPTTVTTKCPDIEIGCSPSKPTTGDYFECNSSFGGTKFCPNESITSQTANEAKCADAMLGIYNGLTCPASPSACTGNVGVQKRLTSTGVYCVYDLKEGNGPDITKTTTVGSCDLSTGNPSLSSPGSVSCPSTDDGSGALNSCKQGLNGATTCPSITNCPSGVTASNGTPSVSGSTLNCNYTFTYIPETGNSQTWNQSFNHITCSDAGQSTVNNNFSCPSPPGTNGFNPFSPVKKVYAQPVPDVIDPNALNKGTYRIVVPGYNNAEFSISTDNASVKYFDDKNANGVKDSGEDYIDPTTFTISVSKLSDLTTYTLNSGWNLIALNFVSNDFKTVSQLAAEMNRQGIHVVQISKYDNGNWIHFAYRLNDGEEPETFGNNFTLVPGEGYFIRALDAGTIVLKGQRFTSSVPLQLNLGWNLESIQSPAKYTANSFLSKCNELGANCTAISKFTDNTYESVVNFENQIFGNNFDIKNTEGYFVLNRGANKIISP